MRIVPAGTLGLRGVCGNPRVPHGVRDHEEGSVLTDVSAGLAVVARVDEDAAADLVHFGLRWGSSGIFARGGAYAP